MSTPKTWLIVGASRGIGLEFVRQIIGHGHRVIATVRNPNSDIDALAKTAPDRVRVLTCDVSREESINGFIEQFVQSGERKIDYAVINAGILKYPNVRHKSLPLTFERFATHLHTNTIGPIIVAQKLLQLANVTIGTIAFMSSDSGSTTRFLAFEDGFAAYSASKAALNQALRHMAEELKRKQSQTAILALHPGEVSTDMSKIDIAWEISGGQITAEESVSAMIDVIQSKSIEHTGTFWTWKNEVCIFLPR
ncbi:3-oxoacyl-[acyl-carrier-protein] reductase, putative [Talaromyces stipitatus ATCC 10500]|uniref:3-oxoacyl-[acyl-carrier-protein] reductase, putative n=1 Tax=Talaromyces stipitatus (strain ATCC 10500 / CBS 375.48 / QM 6759 / NRRL 1006) TaxID=441959 RepID=B8MGX2_TALSN|nr:3-oxoacyl-[acyl-carrier-protein] reductase, putative [Talaromyces stipitatus ATCC 10500]EED16353.1 3-oxoacyl-[acyl-carrier-protein] reductase, putative [Talaromyces stipitatus ATCC 10500]